METTQIRSGTAISLRSEDIARFPLAFEPKSSSSDRMTGTLTGVIAARVIASSFLKYCQEATALLQPDSVESFIALHHLHQELQQHAELFLQQEMPVVQDNRPLNELLLSFASFRLTQASRVYYFESLTAREPAEVETFKQKVQACQRDFDNLIQAL